MAVLLRYIFPCLDDQRQRCFDVDLVLLRRLHLNVQRWAWPDQDRAFVMRRTISSDSGGAPVSVVCVYTCVCCFAATVRARAVHTPTYE